MAALSCSQSRSYECRPSSSRLESGLLSAAVLAEQSIRVVSVDRPGYGQSSPNRNVSIESFAGLHATAHNAVVAEKTSCWCSTIRLSVSDAVPHTRRGSLPLALWHCMAEIDPGPSLKITAVPRLNPDSSIHLNPVTILNVETLVFCATADVEDLAVALRLEKVVVASTGGGAPYALGVASFVEHRVQGLLLISPVWSAGAPARNRFCLGFTRTGLLWTVQTACCLSAQSGLPSGRCSSIAVASEVPLDTNGLFRLQLPSEREWPCCRALWRHQAPDTPYVQAPDFLLLPLNSRQLRCITAGFEHSLRGNRCRFPPSQRT
jgi:pimeloyl-ACP methyl ester carboxylesterase